MDYGLTVAVDGDVTLQKKLVTVQQGLGSFRPLWPDVVTWFSQSEQRLFAGEGFGHWPPLAASTVKKRGSAHPILVESGALRASLVNPSYRVEGEDSIELGTSLTVNGYNLGRLHQRGTATHFARGHFGGTESVKGKVAGRGGMPPRPPIYPSRDDYGRLRELFHRYILGLMTAEPSASVSIERAA